MLDWPNLVGIIGVIIILMAYLRLQSGYMKFNGVDFLLINIIGSVMILFSLMFHWNLASVVIEAAWLLISFYGLVKVFFNRSRV